MGERDLLSDSCYSDISDDYDHHVEEAENSAIASKENDKFTAIRISGDFSSPKLFEYRKKVAITVANSSFFSSVKFRFHDDASIRFEGNDCHGSASFEGYGKLTAKFSDCHFYGRKTIIFHENSSLDCKYIKYVGSLLCKGHADLRTMFDGCSYYGAMDISAKNLITSEEVVGAKNHIKCLYREMLAEFRVDPGTFLIFVTIVFMLSFMLGILCVHPLQFSSADRRNSINSSNTDLFEPVDISVDAVYQDATYTYDEKVNVTVRGTTFMYSIAFKFKKDAHLTFIGVTSKGQTKIEGNALLHTNFHDSSFHSEKEIIFHGDGSVNCNGSTYLARTTFDHHGKLQQNTANCLYVRAQYRT